MLQKIPFRYQAAPEEELELVTKIQVRLRPCCSCWHEVEGLVQGDCWVELIHLIVSGICFATSTVSDKSYTFVELGQISESLSDFSKGRNFFKTIVK